MDAELKKFVTFLRGEFHSKLESFGEEEGLRILGTCVSKFHAVFEENKIMAELALIEKQRQELEKKLKEIQAASTPLKASSKSAAAAATVTATAKRVVGNKRHREEQEEAEEKEKGENDDEENNTDDDDSDDSDDEDDDDWNSSRSKKRSGSKMAHRPKMVITEEIRRDTVNVWNEILVKNEKRINTLRRTFFPNVKEEKIDIMSMPEESFRQLRRAVLRQRNGIRQIEQRRKTMNSSSSSSSSEKRIDLAEQFAAESDSDNSPAHDKKSDDHIPVEDLLSSSFKKEENSSSSSDSVCEEVVVEDDDEEEEVPDDGFFQ